MSLENFENNKDASFKNKYRAKADEEGFVSVGDFATVELGRQAKNISSFLDGEEGMNPDANLGEGLNFKGTSGNYSDMKIHIDDLDEFIKRVRNFYGE
jgi:vacuolar-type H+-ATPase subunit C/Vma6